MEKTLIILKPDAVKRKLIGRIISKIEDKGYSIKNMFMKTLSEDELDYHYAEHKEKSFYEDLVTYMSTGPVIIMVIAGENVIKGMRKLCGATDPLDAEAGTIRGSFAFDKSKNLIHSSDSSESAKREIDFFTS